MECHAYSYLSIKDDQIDAISGTDFARIGVINDIKLTTQVAYANEPGVVLSTHNKMNIFISVLTQLLQDL